MLYNYQSYGVGSPRIAVVACMHGDETIGMQLFKFLKKLKLIRGTLCLIVANPRAVRAKKRYIDQDLNRSFPGRIKGNHEQRLARQLKRFLKNFDAIIDVHATTTDVTGLIIVPRFTKAVRNVLKIFKPRRVALVSGSIEKKTLSYYHDCAICFEYGKNNSKAALQRIKADLLSILKSFRIVAGKASAKKRKPEIYSMNGPIKRLDGYRIDPRIKNFRLIKKGATIARYGSKKQIASFSFYPILFGPKAYPNIWGFTAQRLRMKL